MSVLLVLFLSFLLNIYMCIYIYKKSLCGLTTVPSIAILVYSTCIVLSPFFFVLFSASFICAFCFLSFLLNIYYLYIHI